MMCKCIIVLCLFMFISFVFYAIGIKKQLMINQPVNMISSDNSSKLDSNKKIKQHVPKFMLDLYRQNENGSIFSGPDIVRSVIPKTADSIFDKNDEYYEDKHLLLFDIPNSNKDEELVGAELKILTIYDYSQLTDMERYTEISIFDNSNEDLNFLEKMYVKHNITPWLSFNLTSAVHTLLTNGVHSHLKVIIQTKSYVPYESYFKLSIMPEEENFKHDYPILLLFYNSVNEETKHKRSHIRRLKRSLIEEDYEEDTNFIWDDDNQKRAQSRKLKRARNSCKRKPLYVDFSEIEYDTWIVQPRGYEAFQCQGRCFFPVAEHLSPTKHAIVQTLLHSVAPMKASRSCCVPTKLDAISILYVDHRGILTYRYAYKDMVVSECGCR